MGNIGIIQGLCLFRDYMGLMDIAGMLESQI